MAGHRFSRRRFLAVGTAALAAPAGCAFTDHQQATLDDFIRLSALLTGFEAEQLDRKLAQTYLDAITRSLPPGFDMEVLYREAGLRSNRPPRSYDQIESRAVLENQPARGILEAIMSCWYSGTIPGLQGQIRVATYDQALAWQAITWTTPNMECRGVTGFWSEPPQSGTV